jgi:hypothetical protein
MKNYKLLGNCQVCGRLQAVNRGMSKHGYTVNNGWFNGVCSGENELPMQQDDSVTKQVCETIYAQIAEYELTISNLQDGTITPLTAPVAVWYKAEVVAFADAPKSMQEREVASAIRNLEYRITAGKDHANYITELAKKVAGQELTKEIKAEKAPMIQHGESRLATNGGVYVCVKVEGARVYWHKTVGDKVFKSWTGTTAWRKLELVK